MSKPHSPVKAETLIGKLCTYMVQLNHPTNITQYDDGVEVKYRYNNLTLTLRIDGDFDVMFMGAKINEGEIQKTLTPTGNILIETDTLCRRLTPETESICYNDVLTEFNGVITSLSTIMEELSYENYSR